MDQVLSQALSQVLNQTLTACHEQRLVVAFSGGMDSSVLLHAAKRWLQRHRPELSMLAVHVHHGLSPQADGWANFCQQQCQAWCVALEVHRVVVATTTGSLEQAARQARYQVFDAVCEPGDVLLQGHHGDDQLETRLMRMTRGSGLAGLTGIPLSRPLSPDSGVLIQRPFLSLRRQELANYAAFHGLDWIEDESNQDTRFERNWWRQDILPRIEQRFPGRLNAMLASTEALRSDADALSYLLQPLLTQCVRPCEWPLATPDRLSITALLQQPTVLQNSLLRSWLLSQGVQAPSLRQLQQLFHGVIHTAADAMPSLRLGAEVIRRYRDWLVVCHGALPEASHSEAPHSEIRQLSPASGLHWLGQHWSLDGIVEGEYQVTCLDQSPECARMTLTPAGRPGKRLKALWQEVGIPPWLRPLWPLLLQQQTLRAIPQVAVDARNAA